MNSCITTRNIGLYKMELNLLLRLCCFPLRSIYYTSNISIEEENHFFLIQGKGDVTSRTEGQKTQ